MYQGVNYKDMSVMFQEVHFHNKVVTTPEALLRLEIMIFKGNGSFEVSSRFGIYEKMCFGTMVLVVIDTNIQGT